LAGCLTNTLAQIYWHTQKVLTEPLLRCAVLCRAVLCLRPHRLYIMSNLVGIPWPASLSYPMQVISGLWSTAQGTSIGMECVLPHESKIPLGVQKVLLCLLTPAAILCVIVVFEAIWQKVRPRRYVHVGNQTQLLNGRVGTLRQNGCICMPYSVCWEGAGMVAVRLYGCFAAQLCQHSCMIAMMQCLRRPSDSNHTHRSESVAPRTTWIQCHHKPRPLRIPLIGCSLLHPPCRSVSIRDQLSSLVFCIVFLFLPTWLSTAFSLFTCTCRNRPGAALTCVLR
jgi:hypothetical protein